MQIIGQLSSLLASSPASGNGLRVYPRLGCKFSRAWYQLQVFLHFNQLQVKLLRLTLTAPSQLD